MPRKLPIDISTLVELLINMKNEIIDPDKGKINPPLSKCWEMISEKMNYKISSENEYTIVKMNRYNIVEKLGISLPSVKPFENKFMTMIHTQIQMYLIIPMKISLTSNITLSKEEWIIVREKKETVFKRSDNKNIIRAYYILKPNIWTPIIHSHFFEQTRLACNIVYKRTKYTLWECISKSNN